jgi:hypothetical protein
MKNKATEILNKHLDEYSKYEHLYSIEKDILTAMLEFGKYIEELTKQRCAENATLDLEVEGEIYSPYHVNDGFIDRTIDVSKESILNITSLFE